MGKSPATNSVKTKGRNALPAVFNPKTPDAQGKEEIISPSKRDNLRKAAQGKQLSESYRLSGYYGLKHYEKFLKGKRMSELSASGLEDHALALAVKGLGPRSINHGMDAVKRPYAVYCEKLKLENKLKEAKHHVYKPKKRGILTPEELERIARCPQGTTSRDQLIVLLGAMCGLRRGEVIGLQHSDVDEVAQLIHVQHNYVTKIEGIKGPKCDSFRKVPLPGHVKWLINKVRDEKLSDKFIIPNIGNPDKPCDHISIKRAFSKVLKAIGISEIERKSRRLVFHGLRHTFVSNLSIAGVPQIVVATLSGHSDLDMVKRYSHTTDLIDYETIRKILAKSAVITIENDWLSYV